MRFASDVFLSYVAADDRAAGAGPMNAASRIREALVQRIGALSNSLPSVCDSNNAAPEDAAALVCIVSPASIAVNNAHCEAFASAAGNNVPVSDRVFKILLAPVSRDAQSLTLRSLRPYELFGQDGAPWNARAEHNTYDDRRFWLVIDDLAHAVAQSISNARDERASASEEISKRIYLAETSSDLYDDELRLRRELKRHGFGVHPNTMMPESADEYERAVRSELAQCALSITLIGAQRGDVPPGGSASITEIQYRLALEECRRNPNFHHVIWIPAGLVSDDTRQREFLAAVRQFSQVGSGTELVQNGLEDLKTLVEDTLRQSAMERMAPTHDATHGDAPSLYLIYDQLDRETVAPLQEYVHHQGIDVIEPQFEGDQTTSRQRHQEILKRCDAALIVYGRVREPWVRVKQQDLLKCAGFGRVHEMVAKGIYVGPEMSDSKRHFTAQEMMVIKDFESASLRSLQPFVDKIHASREGARP